MMQYRFIPTPTHSRVAWNRGYDTHVLTSYFPPPTHPFPPPPSSPASLFPLHHKSLHCLTADDSEVEVRTCALIDLCPNSGTRHDVHALMSYFPPPTLPFYPPPSLAPLHHKPPLFLLRLFTVSPLMQSTNPSSSPPSPSPSPISSAIAMSPSLT